MNRALATGLVTAAAMFAGLSAARPAQAQPLALRPDLLQTFNSKINGEGNFLKDSQLTLLNPQSLFWNGVDPVDVFFVNEGAGYRNQLFYNSNGGANTLIFKDISSPNSIMPNSDGPLSLGQGLSLGKFTGPTQISFSIKANGFNDPNGKVYGPNAAANPDKLDHVMALEYFDKVNQQKYVLLGFEDLYGTKENGSDRDFNDVVFAVRGVGGTRATEVPEPSVILGILALGGGALTLRRRGVEG